MNLLWLQVYSLYQSRGCLWLQLESWDHVTRVQPPVETRPHDYLLPTSIQSQTMKKISCSSGIKFTSGYFFFLQIIKIIITLGKFSTTTTKSLTIVTGRGMVRGGFHHQPKNKFKFFLTKPETAFILWVPKNA